MPSKITYRGDDNQEYFVVANKGMAGRWRKDKTIPLVDVVQSFDVMTTTTGSETGEFVRPSKGALQSAFHTSNMDKVVEQIVEHGEEKNM
ncbi:ribosome maturation protein [Phascolomyces articulosus]|uniref:Ribosome maturation protein n=1 Tax=Phascolomyces articulosus TaxID=60185 RepID=A0AAD5KC23_9FUNG|nr:ribosome maturation protein [Phascolomyces articulosus]